MNQSDWDKFRQRYKEVTVKSAHEIENSHVYFAMFSPEYIKDPVCMIQTGIAVCLDKPMYFLIMRGAKLPRHLARIASGWEVVENDTPEAFKAASERLWKKIAKHTKESL